MKTVTYSLSASSHNSLQFYKDLASFTDDLLRMAKLNVWAYIEDYSHFVSENKLERPRSQNEYFIEMLAWGTFWRCYINTSDLAFLKQKTLLLLYKGRSIKNFKPIIDKLRGILMTKWLLKESHNKEEITYENFSKLIDWLEASGEYKEEVKRFKGWLLYLSKKSVSNASTILQEGVNFSAVFEKRCKAELGKYTTQVSSFLESQKQAYHNREDIIASGRKEIEYHLNMVAAEILNRELLERFKNTKKKIVLLPTCMRSRKEEMCEAIHENNNIICTGCTPNCRINIISRLLESKGYEVSLIAHSSDFSEWLKKWQNNPEVGLVGVACVLNLLTGGYEMINLNIPSQCVFLDYCGCKKHWHSKGIPTNLNVDQLMEVLESKNK